MGEKITAVFQNEHGQIYIVLESGAAFTLCSSGGGSPCYWATRPGEMRAVIDLRRKEIEERLAQLRDVPGVDL